MFYRYRVHELDGSDAGEAHYAVMIEPGETIILGAGRRVRVVDAVPVEEGGLAIRRLVARRACQLVLGPLTVDDGVGAPLASVGV